MSNICYKKINKNQKGLSVFMDILFRSCDNYGKKVPLNDQNQVPILLPLVVES